MAKLVAKNLKHLHVASVRGLLVDLLGQKSFGGSHLYSVVERQFHNVCKSSLNGQSKWVT